MHLRASRSKWRAEALAVVNRIIEVYMTEMREQIAGYFVGPDAGFR